MNIFVNDFAAKSEEAESVEEWKLLFENKEVSKNLVTSPVQIPMLLRRRLSLIGRLALSALLELKPSAEETILWASNWGDCRRMHAMLLGMTRGDELSPSQFATSVYNGIGAIASIAFANRRPYYAVAAGIETSTMALIEACSQMKISTNSIVIVRYEDPLPEVWAKTIPDSEIQSLACAYALRISMDTTRKSFQIEKSNKTVLSKYDLIQEIKFLLGYRESLINGSWMWNWS